MKALVIGDKVFDPGGGSRYGRGFKCNFCSFLRTGAFIRKSSYTIFKLVTHNAHARESVIVVTLCVCQSVAYLEDGRLE